MAYCLHVAPSSVADIAQLGERQTEDLKVPGSIPGVGNYFLQIALGQAYTMGHPDKGRVPWHLGRVVKAID